MTLAERLPVRLGTLRPDRHPKHRAIDEIARLQFLLYGANLTIAAKDVQLDDQQREHEETVQRIDARHAETVADLEQQIAELQHRLTIACQASAAADQTQEIPAEVVQRMCTPVPLRQAPFATTDPGRIPPTWARTQ